MSSVLPAGAKLPPAQPLDLQIKTLVDNLPGGIVMQLGDDPVKARDQFRRITVALRDQQPPAELAAIEEITVPGARGELAARVYRPRAEGPTATLLFFHGGGFVVGDIDSHDLQARAIAERTGVTVVSTNYRLAPEDPFPAAADDAELIARWVVANVERFGGDPDRILVGGDSAGGNLAAVCAQQVPGLAGQVLIYATLDFAAETPAHTEHADGPLLTAEATLVVRDAYMADGDPLDPRLSPLRADSFDSQPPAVIVTCEYDLLRDDGLPYANKLREAGLPVTHLHFPSLMHGFMAFYPLSAGCNSALDELCAAIKLLAR